MLNRLFKGNLQTKRNWQNQAISNTVNESSETVMRQYKKNATRKLIVKGHEAQLCLAKQTECILNG